jgi:hypothetical protein
MFRAISSTGTLSWRPIEAKDVPSCAVLLAAIEEADQTGDVFGEEDLLETFRDPGRDYRAVPPACMMAASWSATAAFPPAAPPIRSIR